MGLIDVAISYSFIRDMTVPFEKTDAFKLGIIDQDGKFLKQKDKLETSAEKKAFPNKLTVLAWNIKKILSRIAIGKSTIGSFVSALVLLREEINDENGFRLVEKKLHDILVNELYKGNREKLINELFEFEMLKNKSLSLLEEVGAVSGGAPTNNIGGGMIKGAAPGEDPPIRLKKKKKIYELMGRYTVFEVSPEEFERCSCSKKKFEKWNKFFDEDSETGSSIKNYSHRNPEKGIILRNSETGQTMMLRRRWSDQRLTHNRKAKLLTQSRNDVFSLWTR
jgi:hypothetical protein